MEKLAAKNRVGNLLHTMHETPFIHRRDHIEESVEANIE